MNLSPQQDALCQIRQFGAQIPTQCSTMPLLFCVQQRIIVFNVTNPEAQLPELYRREKSWYCVEGKLEPDGRRPLTYQL